MQNHISSIKHFHRLFGYPPPPLRVIIPMSFSLRYAGVRRGTLGISGWGCAAGTLEPLTYTRASSAEFCYPILE